jgi:hypothetical protein
MLDETIRFLNEHEFPRLIILCLYGTEAYGVFASTFDRLVKTGQIESDE